MVHGVQGFQPFARNVSIDLRGRYVRVAQQHLHDAQAEVEAALAAADAAPWPQADAAFTDVQDTGAGQWI